MIRSYLSTLLALFLGSALTVGAQKLDVLMGMMDSAESAPAAAAGPASPDELLNRLFEKGVAEYRQGNYADAISIFDSVLTYDPAHSAAITYRTRASRRIAAKEADKTSVLRKQAMAEVEEAWNAVPMPVHSALELQAAAEIGSADSKAAEKVVARLKAVTVPQYDVAEATVEEVVQFFAETSRKAGSGEDIDILLVGMEKASANNITISVENISLYETMQYVMDLASLKFEIRNNLVVIMPVNYVPASRLIMKSYDIIPEVGADLTSELVGAVSDDLFGASSDGGVEGPVDVTPFFSLVDFPEGSSAVYQSRFHKLFVRNTAKNLMAMEAMLADLEEKAIQRRAQQVAIETKFVEFNEGALEELSFDWTVYGSGTVAGMEYKDGAYFQKSLGYTGKEAIADGDVLIPITNPLATTVFTDPVTGQKLITEQDGRPGESLFSGSKRDSTGAFSDFTSGVLSTMGGAPGAIVLGNRDLDLRIAAMEQQGKADIMAAPNVTAKSGTEATIRVAETHRYPQDYEVTTGQRTAPVVRPADWQDFDMGVSLRVTPTVDAESGTIALSLTPELMAFKGFDELIVGYNAYDGGGNDNSVGAGDGAPFFARMPYFERRYIEAEVTIADGHTVVMGGLINERTETFSDRVPFLGDIPYLGRLFRSEGSRNLKQNLTIFVKATLVDPSGRTHADREMASN